MAYAARRSRVRVWLDRAYLGGSLLFLTVFSALPFLWVISTALKTEQEINVFPPYWIPRSPTLDNFVRVLTGSELPQSLVNSLRVGVATTVVCLVFAALAGFGLARFRFRGKEALSSSILVGQMVPQAVLLIPLFILLDQLRLIDTMSGLTLSYLTITMPLAVWMMRGYFAGIPRELEEAAMVDGATRLGALVRITLPVARPGVVATALYIFITTWQEFLYALNFTNSGATRTLAIQLHYFSDDIMVDWGLTMAASLLMAIPVMVVFLFMHRHFVRGLSEGGLKG